MCFEERVARAATAGTVSFFVNHVLLLLAGRLGSVRGVRVVIEGCGDGVFRGWVVGEIWGLRSQGGGVGS